MEYTWTRQSGATPFVVDTASVTPAATIDPSPERAEAGGLLADMYRYLSANAEQHPALGDAIAALSSAVAAYRTGQTADPMAGARSVFAAIQTARVADASLPVP